MSKNVAVFATVGVIITVAIISGALFASTFTSSTSIGSTVDTKTQSTITSSSSSTVHLASHGWINNSEGVALHLAPVVFGVDANTNISPLGPSVAVGTASSPVSIPSDTLVAESFDIVGNTLFNEVEFAFYVPKAGGPNVTIAVYVNGNLTAQSTQSLDYSGSYPPNVPIAPVVGAQPAIQLNGSVSLMSNSVVTVAFLANGPLSIVPIDGILGNSTIVSNIFSIPSTWNGPPSTTVSGSVFLSLGLLDPGA
ncbi:MAG TPA: hypothetical protein VJN71_03450 [Nitrososphaerales archaeon]|nr:hypothetical protein [Nitrososphaerales archaeon]